MSLHQDQGAILPIQTPEAPVLVNTMYILQDVNEHNGGTLLIPGSHPSSPKPAVAVKSASCLLPLILK